MKLHQEKSLVILFNLNSKIIVMNEAGILMCHILLQGAVKKYVLKKLYYSFLVQGVVKNVFKNYIQLFSARDS